MSFWERFKKKEELKKSEERRERSAGEPDRLAFVSRIWRAESAGLRGKVGVILLDESKTEEIVDATISSAGKEGEDEKVAAAVNLTVELWPTPEAQREFSAMIRELTAPLDPGPQLSSEREQSYPVSDKMAKGEEASSATMYVGSTGSAWVEIGKPESSSHAYLSDLPMHKLFKLNILWARPEERLERLQRLAGHSPGTLLYILEKGIDVEGFPQISAEEIKSSVPDSALSKLLQFPSPELRRRGFEALRR